jgi:YbbR domain-containing protein
MLPRPHLTLDRVREFADAGNLARFLAALILAFALWAWVTNEQDPEISKTIPSIPVAAVNLPPGLQIVGQLPTVEVSVEGPESVIRNVGSGSIIVQADLRLLRVPDTYQVPLGVRLPDGARLERVEPDKITVIVQNEVQVNPRPGTPVAN